MCRSKLYVQASRSVSLLSAGTDRVTRSLQATAAPACAGRVGTAHAYTTAVISRLAEHAPCLLKVERESDPDHVLLDGTLAECDRVGDSRADYSAKHRRHGVNVQLVTVQ
jgi:hypothetical protein